MLRARLIVLSAVVGLMVVGSIGCSKEEGLKVRKISPKEGPMNGGDPVTIHGSGFQSGGAQNPQVYFGGKKARVLEVKGDAEIIVAPPGGSADQTVSIQVVFADSRRIKIEDAYTYIDPAPLNVGDLTSGAKNDGQKK